MPKFKDCTGHRFGMLVSLGRSTRVSNNGKFLTYENVRCDCGVEKEVFISSLVGNLTKSCGCARAASIASSKITHGHCGWSATYNSYAAMLNRCYNPNNKRFHRYGGRGIIVCARWKNDFSAFLLDMGSKPSGLSIERVDNDGIYEPTNCRWASAKDQAANTSRNRKIVAFGREMNLGEWAEEYGVKRETIARRINAGWANESAVTVMISSVRLINSRCRERRITAFGDERTLSEWSLKFGVSKSTIKGRIKLGWATDAAVSVAASIGRNQYDGRPECDEFDNVNDGAVR